MKQRWFWVILAVCMSLALTTAGCGAGDRSLNTSTHKTTTTPSATTGVKSSTAAVTTKATTKPTTTKAASTTATRTTSATITPSASKTTTLTTASTQTSDDPFAKMDGVLGNLVVRYEKKWMFAEAIGAKEGYKYETTSGTFELYLYDMGSDAYKDAVKNNAMNLSGTLFPAIIKNGFALYFYSNVTDKVRNQIQEGFFD